ncbi:MAG: sugar ABC transporter permease [Clostridia bacterium]|nr:sugar ABC transporter permease [Clostridia bacterium]
MNRHFGRWFPVFVLPTFAAFCVAFLVPFGMGTWLSFHRFTTIDNARWVGVDNYIRAFTEDNEFLRALGFTALFTVVSVVLINLLAFALALALTRRLRGVNILRGVFFMPNLIGGIVLGYVFSLLVNGILGWFGVDITFAATYGFWGLVALNVWQLTGYMMVIYIAGLQNVPASLLEAAAMDGATPWVTLWHVKLPLVMPAVTICGFLTLTNSFKLFDQNLALTAGAPERETSMLALDIYQTFYGRTGWQGVGQAKAVVFFLLVAAIAALQLRLTRRREVEA